MMAKGECEGRRQRTTQEAADAGKIQSAMGEEQRGGASELRFSIWGSHGPLEVSNNGMDEKRFETTYLVLLVHPA